MYILITDYNWFESGDEIYVVVPLKGTSAKNCDVLVSTKYIKIVFKPYIFECALWDNIDVDKSRVVLESSVEAKFTLKKLVSSKWKKLEADEMMDKAALISIRQKAIAEVHAREAQRELKNREEKRLGEKAALKAMMKIEGEERTRHEEIKKQTTFTAMRELVALHNEKCEQSTKLEKLSSKHTLVGEGPRVGNNVSSSVEIIKQDIFKGCEKSEVPIRSADKICVSFTPRVFPTPERESMKEDEEKWLRKQAERKRVLASRITEKGDLSEVEKDPTWLQKKAESLFKAGDFEAAIFAYTEALRRAPKFPSLYLNRSACYLQTRNFFRALEDASTALDLLKPPVPQNLNSRIKAHVRRGVAFCNLQMLKEGMSEYEAAVKLNPADETIQQDLSRLKEMMNKSAK